MIILSYREGGWVLCCLGMGLTSRVFIQPESNQNQFIYRCDHTSQTILTNVLILMKAWRGRSHPNEPVMVQVGRNQMSFLLNYGMLIWTSFRFQCRRLHLICTFNEKTSVASVAAVLGSTGPGGGHVAGMEVEVEVLSENNVLHGSAC